MDRGPDEVCLFEAAVDHLSGCGIAMTCSLGDRCDMVAGSCGRERLLNGRGGEAGLAVVWFDRWPPSGRP